MGGKRIRKIYGKVGVTLQILNGHYKKYGQIRGLHYTTYYDSLRQHKYWMPKKKREEIDKKNKIYNKQFEMGQIGWWNPDHKKDGGAKAKVLLEEFK